MPPKDTAAIAHPFEVGLPTTYNKGPSPTKRMPWMDIFFKNLTRCVAFFVFSILIAILISLFIHAEPAIRKFGFDFIVSAEWDPVAEKFGALVPIYGTLANSL